MRLSRLVEKLWNEGKTIEEIMLEAKSIRTLNEVTKERIELIIEY